MGAALALLPFVLQYLPTVTVGVEQLIAWISGVRAAAQQADVWTTLQEAAFQAALQATRIDPAYQLDSATTAAVPGSAPVLMAPADPNFAPLPLPLPSFVPLPTLATPPAAPAAAAPKPAVKPPPVVPPEPM